MIKILLVGTGGFIGSILRYLMSGLVYQLLAKPWFPYGTMAVNITGCFLIGLCGGLAETRQLFSPEARSFLFIGLFGGFTTFSTFGYETVALLRDGQMVSALSNILLHVILGLGAVVLGDGLSRIL